LYWNPVDKDIQLKSSFVSTQNSSISVKDDWHNFILRPKGALPKQYFFYLRLADNGTEVPTVMKFSLNNATLCNDAIKAAQTIESLNRTANDRENYRHVCGRRSLAHAELTSVRTESLAGDWPWHVALLKKDPYILAGVNNYTDYFQVGRQSLIAEKIVLHPGYSDALATSDLAIIKVNKLRWLALATQRTTDYRKFSDRHTLWFKTILLCGVAPGHTECDPKYYVVYTDVGPHYSWLFHHSGLKYRDNILN
ncbi:hypothetical protein MSG28_002952, partial [Choristoneura fumiferana]